MVMCRSPKRDDCVWFVLPDGRVDRAIPVGNPIHEPSVLNLDQ